MQVKPVAIFYCLHVIPSYIVVAYVLINPFFQLETPVMAKGNVEVWLGDLLNASLTSLHGVIRDAWRAINDAAFNLMGFLGEYPAQVSR